MQKAYSLQKLAQAIYFFLKKKKKKKKETFKETKVDVFNIFAQKMHLELPRRGGSNKYPQCMFWIENTKIRHTPANPSFFLYKSGV